MAKAYTTAHKTIESFTHMDGLQRECLTPSVWCSDPANKSNSSYNVYCEGATIAATGSTINVPVSSTTTPITTPAVAQSRNVITTSIQNDIHENDIVRETKIISGSKINGSTSTVVELLTPPTTELPPLTNNQSNTKLIVSSTTNTYTPSTTGATTSSNSTTASISTSDSIEPPSNSTNDSTTSCENQNVAAIVIISILSFIGLILIIYGIIYAYRTRMKRLRLTQHTRTPRRSIKQILLNRKATPSTPRRNVAQMPLNRRVAPQN